jgi:hypothetical protein
MSADLNVAAEAKTDISFAGSWEDLATLPTLAPRAGTCKLSTGTISPMWYRLYGA